MMNYKLLKMIEEGEHRQQDFKYCINDSRKIARSLSAFANTDGGRLLIGVKDNGRIKGVQSDEEYYMVESAAKIYSRPKVPFSTRQWKEDNKTVLEIIIEPGNNKPYYAKDENGKWIAYIRHHDQNLLAGKILIEVWKKQQSPKGIRFTYTDDEKFLIDYLEKKSTISLSRFMKQAHIPKKLAEQILADFIVLEIIEPLISEKGITFRLNDQFDRENFDL